MAKTAEQEQVILLFDTYGADSKRLHKSFKLAKKSYPAVTIEENGFLPEDVQSVYGYFLGDWEHSADAPGRPCYFNEVKIPDYWQIDANNTMGVVYDLYHERARIFYAEPTHKRQVKTVDWLDQSGKVRYSDHYNKYGAVYARTSFDWQQNPIVKTYFTVDGKEKIVENFVTRDIILNEEKGPKIFNNKTEFVSYFFRLTGYSENRIFFNSLSTPFFVSCQLQGEKNQDVLFWQEPVADEIPGNMQMILRGEASRTGMVYVQKRSAYQRLIQLGADPEKVKLKGFVYPFRQKNQHRPAALICTNSDQIEHCKEIVEALPQVKFHIAALTEMSTKLLAMEQYENVHLYPGAKTEVIQALFSDCDIYLDINHANEIVSALERAFLFNQVIFAFSNTLHNRDMTDVENIYSPQEADRMVQDIRRALENPEELDRRLHRQQAFALAETVKNFLQM